MPPSEAYKFNCYDHGYELKNSIRLFVREWNTATEFELYGSSSGLEGDPDVTGIEGINCDFSPPFATLSCNDVDDWFDFVKSQDDGIYKTDGSVMRSSFFPYGKEWDK